MSERQKQHYRQVDLPFYKEHIAPILPRRVLDFHAHIWSAKSWRVVPWQKNIRGAKYMTTTVQYSITDLLKDGGKMFPDRSYNAVCFGCAIPSADITQTNRYTARTAANPRLYPLIITGRDMMPAEQLQQAILQKGFFGYKVFLNWHGDNYGDITVEDMIGPAEMKLADRLRLIVLLHVPRAGRLADTKVQQGVRRLSQEYPKAQIVLAHCGRCYLPDEMKSAIESIVDLKNVYLDTAMVMDPTVLEIILDNIDSRRVLFATDFPVAAMRGRRVYVTDHWVDLVLEGYPAAGFRVGSDNMRATFMAYEIILAIRRAAQRVGLSKKQLCDIFFENGIRLLGKVRVAGK